MNQTDRIKAEYWRKSAYESCNNTPSFKLSCLRALISDPRSWLNREQKAELKDKIAEISSGDCSEEFSPAAKDAIRSEFERYFKSPITQNSGKSTGHR